MLGIAALRRWRSVEAECPSVSGIDEDVVPVLVDKPRTATRTLVSSAARDFTIWRPRNPDPPNTVTRLDAIGSRSSTFEGPGARELLDGALEAVERAVERA